MLENASFIHVFDCMCMLELTITGWWIIVAYLSIPNWFKLQLVSQLASYLFSYFLLRSLLPFSNSKFFLISCLTKCLSIKILILVNKTLQSITTICCCNIYQYSDIPYSRKVWWVERLANLVNHLRFTKLMYLLFETMIYQLPHTIS